MKLTQQTGENRGSRDGAAPVSDPASGAWTDSPAEPGMGDWMSGLEREARTLLQAGRTDVWDVLSRRFEARLIQVALEQTRGRRIEAAQRLGIGRNTITRKLQELGVDPG